MLLDHEANPYLVEKHHVEEMKNLLGRECPEEISVLSTLATSQGHLTPLPFFNAKQSCAVMLLRCQLLVVVVL
jgi:glutamate racemase